MCNHKTPRNGAVRKSMLVCKSCSEIRRVDNITICSPPSSWDTAAGNFIREGWDATLKTANTYKMSALSSRITFVINTFDGFILYS